MVSQAAVLVTQEAVFSRLIEAGADFGYLARKNHYVDIGALNYEAMLQVRAGHVERHCRAGRNFDLVRHEGPDLSSHIDVIAAGSSLNYGRIGKGRINGYAAWVNVSFMAGQAEAGKGADSDGEQKKDQNDPARDHPRFF